MKSQKKRFSFSTLITLVILAVALAISVTMMIAMRYFNRQVNAVTQRQVLYSHINDIDSKVRELYTSIDEEQLRSALAAGYVAGLSDPYAQYLNTDAYQRMQLLRRGQASGVGLRLKATDEGLIAVESVAADSAAQRAGLQAGDILISVDGNEVRAADLASVQSLMEISAERMLLSVRRSGQTMAFEVTAYTYQIESVHERMLNDTVGYIQITAFYDNTDEQFRSACSALENQGAVNFIFDLRGCSAGGSRESLESMLSYLMPHGVYAIWNGSNGESYNLVAENAHVMTGSSVTLVNGDTRGEAELFAGIMQEFSMTTVIGEQTAGKGKLQDFVSLNADNSALLLTVGEITLMRGGSIEGVGITPNTEVTMSDDKAAQIGNMEDTADDQLQAALTVFTTNIGASANAATATAAPTTAGTTAAGNAAEGTTAAS